MSASAQTTRVNEMNIALAKAHEIDNSVNVLTDLFNAETLSIVELKAAIDNDANITNKPYALASEVKARFLKNQQVIFDANQTISDAVSKQKAEQVYLNTLANQLRSEEREKLKIADINYQPGAVKAVKPATIKTKKIDKAEVKKFAAESGIPEYMIQQTCVQKNISPEDATKEILAFLAKAKAASSNIETK